MQARESTRTPFAALRKLVQAMRKPLHGTCTPLRTLARARGVGLAAVKSSCAVFQLAVLQNKARFPGPQTGGQN
eukprot:1664568-Alexandrium_andersonii.AAC.1